MSTQTTTAAATPAPPRVAWLPGAVGVAGIVAILTAALVLAADGAAGPSLLVPAGHHVFPAWLAGPLRGLGERTTPHGAGALLVTLLVGWIAVVAAARHVPARTLAAAIVAAHGIVLLAPPLFSADVFGYIGFARIGAVHHLDPYVWGTASAPGDPVQPFLRWHDAHTPYGPLFTLLSYVFVPLGIAGAYWAFKVCAAAASLAATALVARAVQADGRDARTAAALVGLSPVLLVFELAGGHNDALMMLAAVAGIALLPAASGRGAATLVVAAGLKASAALVLPFAVIGAPDRRRAIAGAAIATVAIGAVALAGFHGGLGGLVRAVPAAGGSVATFSVPNTVARLLGAHGAGHAVHVLGIAVAALATLALLEHTRRGADWVTSAGWATVVLLVSTTWLLPWYGTWLTPLAALSPSRRLHLATLAFVAYVTLTRVTFLTP